MNQNIDDLTLDFSLWHSRLLEWWDDQHFQCHLELESWRQWQLHGELHGQSLLSRSRCQSMELSGTEPSSCSWWCGRGWDWLWWESPSGEELCNIYWQVWRKWRKSSWWHGTSEIQQERKTLDWHFLITNTFLTNEMSLSQFLENLFQVIVKLTFYFSKYYASSYKILQIFDKNKSMPCWF